MVSTALEKSTKQQYNLVHWDLNVSKSVLRIEIISASVIIPKAGLGLGSTVVFIGPTTQPFVQYNGVELGPSHSNYYPPVITALQRVAFHKDWRDESHRPCFGIVGVETLII
jgi:hypothetical protein